MRYDSSWPESDSDPANAYPYDLASTTPKAAMIDLYYWTTPNGQAAITRRNGCTRSFPNIGKGEQSTRLLKIAPNNRIPAIVDRAPEDGAPIRYFESGATLLLADSSGACSDRSSARLDCTSVCSGRRRISTDKGRTTTLASCAGENPLRDRRYVRDHAYAVLNTLADRSSSATTASPTATIRG
jgi:hypothetical protein